MRLKWTPELEHVLLNPLYCLGPSPSISEDEWIRASLRLLRKLGPATYLRMMLAELKPHLSVEK